MAQAWPAQLQDVFNQDSFQYQIGETVIRSSMDIGPAKVRRRFTKPINEVTGSIWVSVAEFQIFYNFFNTTLNGGTLPFDFYNPLLAATKEYRFKGPPRITPVGFETYRLDFNWEELS